MSPANRYARQFAAHRSVLIDLYDLLPDDQGTFTAWDGGMSFIGLADHLSGSAARMVDMIGGQGMGAPAPTSTTLAQARERLRQTQDTVVSALEALGEEELNRRVPAFGGREMPVGALLEMLTTHEAHHKGQAWMMARMVGVQPPMFIRLG